MTMVKRIFSVMLAMMLLLGCAVAEEEALGNFPSRGMILSLTQADVDMGLEVAPYVDMITMDGEDIKIPMFIFQYVPEDAVVELDTQLDAMYTSGNFDDYLTVLMEYYSRCYTYARIFLLTDEKMIPAVVEYSGEVTLLGENDGYTYMLATYDVTVGEKDDPAVLEALQARVVEMLNTIQYQPVVIPEGELDDDPETVIPNAFPAFTTQDLNGNTVDNSLFANADLTVLNIWSTTCMPCISEMPELQAWSEEMPENVQMVGLVLDVGVGDAAALEEAQMICELTGVTYANLMRCEDLYEFAQGIIFTPTTIFVDRNGAVVGEPITGARVDDYKAFVKEYTSAQ